MAIGPTRKAKAPKYPTGIPGAPGVQYSKSSMKKPVPTGYDDPSNPNYGTMGSGSVGNAIARMNGLFKTGSRDLRNGQSDLRSKAARSFD